MANILRPPFSASLGLGRIHEVDDRDWPMQLALPGEPSKRTRRMWTPDKALDQGNTPECVGYAWKKFLQCTPLKTADGPSADEIYQKAKQIDGHPEINGSTVRAGVQALNSFGRIRSYVFAQSLNDVIQWLLTHGPVVTGLPWFDGMFQVDQQGFVWPRGNLAGGHAFVIYGFDANFYAISSWGTNFGINHDSKFLLRPDVFDMLMHMGGEACSAVERKVVA